MPKRYVLTNHPLGEGEGEPETQIFEDERALRRAVAAFRELIEEYAENAVELYRDPDTSPRTVYGESPDLSPYLTAAFELGQAENYREIVLKTHLEKVVLTTHDE